MKGIELPINILIIVVVAIIVLVAIVALFAQSWNPGTKPISLESSKSNACQILSSRGCQMSVYDVPVNPSFDGRYTNSSAWSASFIINAQNYRSIIRAYTGTGSETNAVVTAQTIYTFLSQNPSFISGAGGSTNVANMLIEAGIAPSFLQWGDATTAIFWRNAGRLIP